MSLQSLIQSNKEKFDEQFPVTVTDEESSTARKWLLEDRERHKAFLAQAMTDTAKEMAESVKLEAKEYPGELLGRPERHGYNQAKSELDQKIDKFLEN